MLLVALMACARPLEAWCYHGLDTVGDAPCVDPGWPDDPTEPVPRWHFARCDGLGGPWDLAWEEDLTVFSFYYKEAELKAVHVIEDLVINGQQQEGWYGRVVRCEPSCTWGVDCEE